MICFGFLNPQVIRLMLDRSKFNTYVVPAAANAPRKSIDFYIAALKEKSRQTPVFIFPDFTTASAVFRSGSFDINQKYVLCAAASKLEEHGLEPIDASFKGAVWQVKQTMSATVNSSILKMKLEEDTIAKLAKKVERVEHNYSNPKVVEKKIVDIREAFALLKDKRTDAGEAALMKFLMFGFVAKELSRHGETADEIVNAGRKTFKVKNRKAFVAYIKAKRIPMTKEAADAVFKIQMDTSIVRTALKFWWKVVINNRPESLACAETGCEASFGVIMQRYLKQNEVPTPKSVLKNPEVVRAFNANYTTRDIKSGWYTMVGLVNAIGVQVTTEDEARVKSGHNIKFSRNPLWRSSKNWWSISKTSKPLVMLFNGIKYKFVAV